MATVRKEENRAILHELQNYKVKITSLIEMLYDDLKKDGPDPKTLTYLQQELQELNKMLKEL